MANPEHLAKLKEGVEAWNEWRHADRRIKEPDLRHASLEKTNLRDADLSRVDLREASLREANLSGAVLWKANLSHADLWGTDLSGASLEYADFIGANLRATFLNETTFREANLTEAELNGAALTRATFHRTHLSGTNFDGALCSLTVFFDTDLSQAKRLEHVRHRGPSTVGIDTLYRSKGKIPQQFLQGCGVPDVLIDYIPSLVGDLQPIQFYSCFISYSHKNEDFAQRLHSRLRDEQLRVWYAPEDLKAGRKIHEEIDQAIRIHDKLLLVLSNESMASEWVKTEIANARRKEIKTGKRVLFPVRLVDFNTIRGWTAFDADTGKDSAREIREYYIPDFSDWKDHDSFETGFAKLLDALKKDEIAEPEGE